MNTNRSASVMVFSIIFFLTLPVGPGHSEEQQWQDFPEWIVSQEDYLKSKNSEVRGTDVTGDDSHVTTRDSGFTQTDDYDESIDFIDDNAPDTLRVNPSGAAIAPKVSQPQSQPSKTISGVVTAAGVNCRRGPSLYEPVVFQFREGAFVVLDDFRDGWYQVIINGPVAGWMSSKFVKVTQAASAAAQTGDSRFDQALSATAEPGSQVMVGTVTGDNVNVRMGPTLDDPFVSRAFKGERVVVKEERDDWVRICWITPRKGWIHESLVKEVSQVEGTVLSAGADIRIGPGSNHDLVRRVLRGMKLPVIDQNPGWYKVAIPTGQVGYIAESDFEPPANLKISAPNIPSRPQTSESEGSAIPGVSGSQTPGGAFPVDSIPRGRK